MCSRSAIRRSRPNLNIEPPPSRVRSGRLGSGMVAVTMLLTPSSEVACRVRPWLSSGHWTVSGRPVPSVWLAASMRSNGRNNRGRSWVAIPASGVSHGDVHVPGGVPTVAACTQRTAPSWLDAEFALSGRAGSTLAQLFCCTCQAGSWQASSTRQWDEFFPAFAPALPLKWPRGGDSRCGAYSSRRVRDAGCYAHSHDGRGRASCWLRSPPWWPLILDDVGPAPSTSRPLTAVRLGVPGGARRYGWWSGPVTSCGSLRRL
jgi:hypothetical protein